jgi:hypothetical protein
MVLNFNNLAHFHAVPRLRLELPILARFLGEHMAYRVVLLLVFSMAFVVLEAVFDH